MPTLPSDQFTEAVNRNGIKQVIPKSWLEDGSPFAGQFRLPPSAVARRAKAAQKPADRSGDSQPETPPSGDNEKE